jgi:hypothetical protein
VKRRRLVRKVEGTGKAPAEPAVLVQVWPRPVGHPYGVDVDGAVYPLQGEPPLATTKGWGRVPGQQLGRPFGPGRKDSERPQRWGGWGRLLVCGRPHAATAPPLRSRGTRRAAAPTSTASLAL